MGRAIDVDEAIKVAEFKYNEWARAMARAVARQKINPFFEKQELFKAVKIVLDCVPTLPQSSNGPLTLDVWVNVKDGLPKENKRVLVHVVNAPTLDVDTDRIVGGQWVRWAGSITHWMPLPEPPKKEN